MNFFEAMQELKQGKKVREKRFSADTYLYLNSLASKVYIHYGSLDKMEDDEVATVMMGKPLEDKWEIYETKDDRCRRKLLEYLDDDAWCTGEELEEFKDYIEHSRRI